MNKVKLANCTPEGRFSVTTEIFEGHYWDLDLFSGIDDYEKTGKCYTLPIHGEWVAGRKADVELDIPIETDDDCMSRRHAVFTLSKNVLKEFILTVRGVKEVMNPIYVGRIPINHKFNMQLFDGDMILMGKSFISVHINQQ